MPICSSGLFLGNVCPLWFEDHSMFTLGNRDKRGMGPLETMM